MHLEANRHLILIRNKLLCMCINVHTYIRMINKMGGKEVGFSEKRVALYWMEQGFYVEPHGIHTWDDGTLLQIFSSPER